MRDMFTAIQSRSERKTRQDPKRRANQGFRGIRSFSCKIFLLSQVTRAEKKLRFFTTSRLFCFQRTVSPIVRIQVIDVSCNLKCGHPSLNSHPCRSSPLLVSAALCCSQSQAHQPNCFPSRIADRRSSQRMCEDCQQQWKQYRLCEGGPMGIRL